MSTEKQVEVKQLNVDQTSMTIVQNAGKKGFKQSLVFPGSSFGSCRIIIRGSRDPVRKAKNLGAVGQFNEFLASYRDFAI